MKKCLQTFFLSIFLSLAGIAISFAQPSANFTINYPTPDCAPATISFTNTSTGIAPLTYNWVFINSQNSDTATNPTFTFDSCGNFSVTLQVTDSNGLTNSITQTVSVYCVPFAKIVTIQSTSCDTSFVHFNDAGTGMPTTRKWRFGDPASGSNDSSALKSPFHHYSSPGDYIVTLKVFTSTGCSDSTSDTLHVPATPQAAFTMNDSIVCLSDTVKFSDASVSADSISKWVYNFGDPGSGNSNIDSSQNAKHVFSSSGEFTVTLTVTTTFGCEKSTTHSVKVNPLPIADAGSDQSICAGDSAQLNATGGISFLWHPGSSLSDSVASNPSAFPLSTQKYFVTVTDTNGCSAVDSVTVNVHSVNANTGNDTAICFGSSATLHASGGISYSWQPSSSLSDSTSATPIASPTQTTTYTVTITDNSGCSGKDSVTVSVHAPIIISFVNLDSFYCANHEAVNLEATPSGGIFSGDGVSGNQFLLSSLQPDSSYAIFYFYSDSIGCNATDTAEVFIRSLPNVDVTADVSQVCKNGNPVSFQLNPTGGLLSGDGISGEVFNPLLVDSPGDYKIFYTKTDSFGCSNTDGTTITVLSLPQITLSHDTTICENDSVQLTASGGIHYLWTPSTGLSNDTIPNPIAFPASTTKYFVTVTDANGCSATDSVLISIFSLVSIDAGHDTSICIGESTTLNASGGAEYLWSPSIGLSDSAIANPSASPLVTTTYTVTVFAGSCSGKDSVTITVNPLPIVEAGHDTFVCKGTSAQLNASGAVNYSWTPTASLNDPLIQNPLATPDESTKYFVSGTDLNGCKNVDSVLIVVKNLPTVTASEDTSICLGETVQLSATGTVSYLWHPNNSLSDSTVSNPVASPVSTTEYVVTGSDVFGCSDHDTVIVQVNYSGNFISAIDTSTCFGSPITLSATGAESYSWSPGIFLNDSTIANPTATLITTTTFILTAVSQGCGGKDTITVFVNPLPVITASDDTTICSGSSIQLHVTGGITYQWSPDSSLINPESPNPTATPQTTTTYSVTGTDANGCSTVDEVTVHVNPSPNITIQSDTSICMGDTILMIASGALNYEWQPTTGLSSPNTASTLAFPQATTTYSVTGTDVNSCSNSATTTIIVHALPNVDAGNDQQVCANVPVQLSASGGVSYSWLPLQGLNNANISNPLATINVTTTYTVTAANEFSCINKDSVTLTVVPPLNATASNDTVICLGSSVQLFATGGTTYQWSPTNGLNESDIPNPIASPASSTTYTLHVSDGICYTDTFEITVLVQNLPAVNAGPDAIIVSGAPYQMIVAASGGIYQWLPETGLSCTNCLSPTASPTQTTTYTLTVTDSLGCSASDEVTLSVNCGEDVIYIPNAFTPNDNGHNDVLYIRSLGAIDLNYFRIYDRWGKMIFETHDLSEGWDGKYNGKPMMPGVYLYEWEAQCSGGDVFRKEGNVTLLR